MRSIYLLQPFHVGSKNAKSTALVVPCAVVKDYNIDTSTAYRQPKEDHNIGSNAIL